MLTSLLLPLAVQHGRVLGFAAATALALSWIDHRAYKSGQAACQTEQSARLSRQIQAARAVEAEARLAVAEIETRRIAIEDQQRRIADAVDDLDGGCLPAGVVRQLSRIGVEP